MSQPRRRYHKRQERRVWVFSELNPELRPADVSRILAQAALELAARDHAAAHERPLDDSEKEAS